MTYLVPEFVNFLAVEQKLARPARCMVELSCLLVRGDMTIFQPGLAPIDANIGLCDADLSCANRFDLTAFQDQTGFIMVKQNRAMDA